MKCHICDRELSEKEINYNEQTKEFEPCATCLDIIMETAYCDGFITEDDEYVIIDEHYTDGGDAGDIIPRYKDLDYE